MKIFVPITPPILTTKKPVEWIVKINLPPKKLYVTLSVINCHNYILPRMTAKSIVFLVLNCPFGLARRRGQIKGAAVE